jgi:N-acetyl-beta-hexosaminidase
VLHPLHPQTLVLIEGILTQIAEIFPSPYLHVGGDEVMTECWLEDPVLVCQISPPSLSPRPFVSPSSALSVVKGDQLQGSHRQPGPPQPR